MASLIKNPQASFRIGFSENGWEVQVRKLNDNGSIIYDYFF